MPNVIFTPQISHWVENYVVRGTAITWRDARWDAHFQPEVKAQAKEKAPRECKVTYFGEWEASLKRCA